MLILYLALRPINTNTHYDYFTLTRVPIAVTHMRSITSSLSYFLHKISVNEYWNCTLYKGNSAAYFSSGEIENLSNGKTIGRIDLERRSMMIHQLVYITNQLTHTYIRTTIYVLFSFVQNVFCFDVTWYDVLLIYWLSKWTCAYLLTELSPNSGTLPRRIPTDGDIPTKPRIVSPNRTVANTEKVILPKDMEDLIHLPGPLTEDAVMRTLQARFTAGKFFVSKYFYLIFN